jgi:hypothetical protein
MKNRAKCKLCQSIIESFHSSDYVICKCGEIAVDGGSALKCSARDWKNFLRVDDEGNEIIIQIQETDNVKLLYNGEKPSKKELLDMLDEMIKGIDRLPEHAKSGFINHYDFVSSLLLLSEILRAD